MLSIGTLLATDLTSMRSKRAVHGGADASDATVGMSAALAAASLSAGASVFFEMMLKKPTEGVALAAGLWLRNVQLGTFAFPLAVATAWVSDGNFIAKHGALQGFSPAVWMVVVLTSLGGLLVAACMKYADNILKCFATAFAIIVGTILSVPIFDFTISPLFVVGGVLTVLASVLYAWAPGSTLAKVQGMPTAVAVAESEGLVPRDHGT